MSKIKTIFKNMGWIFISQVVGSICGFIWTILLARYLGVNNYGIYGFAVSFTGILAVTMDFGISVHIVRHVSTNYDSTSKYLGNTIPLKSIFIFFTFLLTLIILILMGCDELTITVTLLFTLEMAIKSISGLFSGTFMAFEEGKYQGIGGLITNLTLLAFILISIYTDLGIIGISVSYVISNIATLIYSYIKVEKNFAKPKYEFDKEFCKKIVIISLPFAISGIFSSIYYSIDTVMLTNMVGEYATGIYNASYKLISFMTFFYSVYTAVIFPVMSKLFKNDDKLLVVSLEKSIKYLLLITIPLAFAIVFYSTDIIHLIYGHEYDAASKPLCILIWTVCFLFINGACSVLLNSIHKEKLVTVAYMITAIFNIVLNLYMIPHYSFNGAAISTVLSDVLIFIIFMIIIKQSGKLPNKRLILDSVKIIVGTAILGIALYFLNLNMWVALPVGIIIYFASVYLLRLFDDTDKYIIKEILDKN